MSCGISVLSGNEWEECLAMLSEVCSYLEAGRFSGAYRGRGSPGQC